MYSDLPNNRAANFIPMIGIKFAAQLFGRSEYSEHYPGCISFVFWEKLGLDNFVL